MYGNDEVRPVLLLEMLPKNGIEKRAHNRVFD
jgi:hypothetical protein